MSSYDLLGESLGSALGCARRIVESDPNMRAVVCFTRSGYTAFLLSKVHPNAPVYAVTPNESVCRRLSLARSVRSKP